jgi:C1A family cysteine protease
MKITKYGWSPDLPDQRDHKFGLQVVTLPKSVDLRPQDAVPVYDQGQLGSCTGNAISAAYAFDLKKQKEAVFIPSRLFIYYNERLLEHTTRQDAGAAIRDGIKTIATYGVCDETQWPYNISSFAKKPTKACYTAAAKQTAVKYQRVDNTIGNNIKAALASGFPVVFGFSVYASFESAEVARTGVVPMPKSNEQLLGGHAVLAMGYTTDNKVIVRNSWGTGWGDKGYFYIPLEYLTNNNLADDFWVVQAVK